MLEKHSSNNRNNPLAASQTHWAVQAELEASELLIRNVWAKIDLLRNEWARLKWFRADKKMRTILTKRDEEVIIFVD
eukprot:167033-Amphidinium_carterae.2